MRVFFVTTEFINPNTRKICDGGLANYLRKITYILTKIGHEVHVVMPYQKGQDVVLEGVHVHFTKQSKNMAYYLKKFFSRDSRQFRKDFVTNNAYRFIEAEHRREPIDIIQFASSIRNFRLPAHIPHCVRISSYEKLWARAYQYENLSGINNEVALFKKVRFVYGPSRRINEYIRKDLNLTHEFTVIETPYEEHNTLVEDDVVYHSLRGQIGQAQYLLFFGTIGRLKGSDEIADVIFPLLSQHRDIYFVLVGKNMNWGGKGYYHDAVEYIRTKAKEHAGRVIHIPSQPHASLYPFIRNAKAVVLPSRIDNFPNTCVEAMRLKKVIVGTRDASFDQLLDDGRSGFLCDAENPPSLLGTLQRLMQVSDDRLRIMGEAAYERTQTLAPEIIAKQVLDYYCHVIQNWQLQEQHEAF